MPADNTLDETLARAAQGIVDLAAELVSVPTENPPGSGYAPCVEVLARRIEALGLAVELLELDERRTAVLAGVGTGPTVYLHGHYDVVPASAPGQFSPRVVGGRLWGRGSADMKGGVAAMAFAVAAVAEVVEPNGRVELVVVPDEETGGERGSRRLHELGRLGADGVGAILGEPTSGVIWNAHRGAITLRVEMSGRPAHVGLHYQGANAFEASWPVLAALAELKREVEARLTSFHVDDEAARSSILMVGGEVRGGHQFNVVPERFSFTVERRFNPEEDPDDEKARLLEVIHGAVPAGANARVSILQEAPASATDESGSLVRALRSAAERVGAGNPACRLCPGLLESRFYAMAGVPAVAFGPGDLEVSHGPDESVDVGRLLECARIYAHAAVDLLAP